MTSCDPQVIYKKFNTQCPLEDLFLNISDVGHGHGHGHSAVNVTEDMCEAKMFTVNSQVRGVFFLNTFLYNVGEISR